MNLPRLRELAQAGKDGSIRPGELQELFAALPEVITQITHLRTDLDWFVATVENVIDDVMGADEEETQEVLDACKSVRERHAMPR